MDVGGEERDGKGGGGGGRGEEAGDGAAGSGKCASGERAWRSEWQGAPSVALLLSLVS